MFFLKQSAKKNMEWLVVATRSKKVRDAIHLRKKDAGASGWGCDPTRLPFGEKPRWQAPAEQCLPAARPASPALGACGATPLVSACGAHHVCILKLLATECYYLHSYHYGVNNVFQTILNEFKNCIRENRYIVTLHGEEEMDEDDLSIYDVESAILSGTIVERQKQKDSITKEWKYIVCGQIMDGSEIEVVAKLSATRKMIIITVYRGRGE